MSGARLFVALELPDDVRAALAAWGAACAAADPALRAVRPEGLHLTVHFLGQRPEDEIDALGTAVRATADGAPGPLAGRLAGALWLAPRRPHVLTCSVEDAGGALAALHAALAPTLAAAAPGWRAERRALRPHVTVARVRRGARPRVGQEPGPPEGALRFPALTLQRSEPGPGGARYTALVRAALPA